MAKKRRHGSAWQKKVRRARRVLSSALPHTRHKRRKHKVRHHRKSR